MAEGREKTGGRQASVGLRAVGKNIIGGRVRTARQRNQPRLTQADLAARVTALGVPLDGNAVSKIERFQREVLDYELRAIGEALNVTIRWLADEKELI